VVVETTGQNAFMAAAPKLGGHDRRRDRSRNVRRSICISFFLSFQASLIFMHREEEDSALRRNEKGLCDTFAAIRKEMKFVPWGIWLPAVHAANNFC
jgi:hypothetical protein